MTINSILTRRATLALLAVIAAVIVLLLFQQSKESEVEQRAESAVEQNAESTMLQSTESEGIQEMSIGAEDAPITVIEYASFTCPHCANFHSDVLPSIKENYIDTGKVRMIYRGVYFDQLGLWADMMARCGGPDKYFGLAALVYEKQSEWTSAESAVSVVDNLYAIGRLAGLNDADMKACMQNNETAQDLVKSSTENAEADGINATPTFVINGQTMSNMAYSGFVDEFERLLAE